MKQSLHKDDLTQMGREYFESLEKPELINVATRLLETATELWDQVNQDSHNSSKPPSSDSPYKTVSESSEGNGESDKKKTSSDTSSSEVSSESTSSEEPTESASPEDAGSLSATRPRAAGRQPGSPGFWRTDPLTAESVVPHHPETCAACGACLSSDPDDKPYMGYYVLELENPPSGLRVVCRLHHYYSKVCPCCGHESKARPGRGAIYSEEGRRKDLRLQEYVLVGPLLATFIASLSGRYRLSRVKIQEFLLDWLSLRLSVGTIDRCIRETGMACEPVVEELLEELQQSDILHVDETTWPECGRLKWLWVVISVTLKIAVYRVGSRKKIVFLELVSEAFLGWLVSDGYQAYRSYEKRQRCLAHLIRKAVALAEGVNLEASQFGEWLLKELRGLIQAVAEGIGGEQEGSPVWSLILARLKRACLLGRDGPTQQMRAVAREILNDWEAVVAFVKHPALPPTNNEAERALRHAVISRRISQGTRTPEGSRAYSALLSVIETCRLRGINPWDYIADVLACGRKGLTPPPVPEVIGG